MKMTLKRAIEEADCMLEEWTTEEVYQYAFDRLVDELLEATFPTRKSAESRKD